MTAARIRLAVRLGGFGSELSPFIVWSLVGHVVFVAVMMLAPSLRPKKPFPDHPIVVDLVSAPRPPGPRVQAAPPAPPEEKPEPEGVTLETKEPEVKPLPKKDPPKKEKKEPPKNTPPAPPASGPPSEVEETAPQGPAGAGGAQDGASVTGGLEGGDVQFAWYRDSVSAALYSQWRRPVLSGLREAVEVRITFEILRDGSVRRLQIEQTSGVDVFDRSALRAVGDASPLPPLPAGWREPTLPAVYVFRLHPE